MSGVDAEGASIRKGSADAVALILGGQLPEDVQLHVDKISRSGGTPLVVATCCESARGDPS